MSQSSGCLDGQTKKRKPQRDTDYCAKDDISSRPLKKETSIEMLRDSDDDLSSVRRPSSNKIDGMKGRYDQSKEYYSGDDGIQENMYYDDSLSIKNELGNSNVSLFMEKNGQQILSDFTDFGKLSRNVNNRYVQHSESTRDPCSDSDRDAALPSFRNSSSLEEGSTEGENEKYMGGEQSELLKKSSEQVLNSSKLSGHRTGKEFKPKGTPSRTPSFNGRTEIEKQTTPNVSSSHASIHVRTKARPTVSETTTLETSLPTHSLSKGISRQGISSPSFYSAAAKHFDLNAWEGNGEEDNVQVIVRIRPLNSKELSASGPKRCIRQDGPHSLTFLTQSSQQLAYTFDHVASEKISQENLFRVAGLPMVENCISGYNSTLFAYGQTGSGKTHTMLGCIDGPEDQVITQQGITPRVFEHLFQRIKQEEDGRRGEQLQFKIHCSFLEIYNEHVSDLLDPTKTNLQIREDQKKGQFVEGLTQVCVSSLEEVVQLLIQGSMNRKVAATDMNKESSRSHSVFTGTIESTWMTDHVVNTRFGRMNLVDLAGSERQKSSGATGDRLKEASSINKSLTHLGHVIMVLSEIGKDKKDRHVPYRDSKLTFLLQDSLGGNSKTTMIANISPSSLNETLSTLKFAARAKFMRNKAVVNEDTSGDVDALKDQIRKLKEELSRFRKLSSSPLGKKTLSPPLKESSHRLSTQGGSASLTSGSHVMAPSKKVKALETVIAGSLRREQQLEASVKQLKEEVMSLNQLIQEREDSIQNQRMVLRFREEKIHNLETACKGSGQGDERLRKEIRNLRQENSMIRTSLEKHPEVFRLAVENMKLSHNFETLLNFVESGEREAMAAEIDGLRNQVLELLEEKTASEKQQQEVSGTMAGKEETLKEMQLLRDEVEKASGELSRCLESNATMALESDKQMQEIQKLRSERSAMEAEIANLKGQKSPLKGVRDKEMADLIAHIQQRQNKAEEDTETIFDLRVCLKQAEVEIASLKERLQVKEDNEARSLLLEAKLKETEGTLNVALEAAAAAEKDKNQLETHYKEMIEEQRLAFEQLEGIKKSVEVTSKIREENLKKDLEEAEALLEEIPLSAQKYNSSHNKNIARTLFIDSNANPMTPSPLKMDSIIKTHSGRIMTDEELRSKAEERAKRRKAELSAAHEACNIESSLRKAAEGRISALEREVEELAGKLDRANAELAKKEKELAETEARNVDTMSEYDGQPTKEVIAEMEREMNELRDELYRERELISEVGVTAEEEWRRRQESEMQKASVERELLIAVRELEEVKKLQMESTGKDKSRRRVSAMDSDLRERSAMVEALTKEKLSLEKAVREKEEAVEALRYELSKAKTELLSVKELSENVIKEREAKLSDLQSQLSQLGFSCNDLRAMAEVKENELVVLRAKMAELEGFKDEYERMEEKMELLQAEKDSLAAAVKDHELLGIENMRVQSEALATQKKLEEQIDELSKLAAKVEDLKRDNDKKDSEVMRMDSQVKRAEAENGELTRQIEALKAALSEAKGSLNREKQQAQSEAGKSGRIFELEGIIDTKQKEIFALNLKLAESESMTHDAIMEVLISKHNSSNVSAMAPSSKADAELIERAGRRSMEFRKIESDMSTLQVQKEELIRERERWLEEIKQRQTEMVAARLAAEKLHARDAKLAADNDRLQREVGSLRQRVVQLDAEVKKLSGQQNLQQRIHHHAKIKEENYSLRGKCESMAEKLTKAEAVAARLSEEVAKYRVESGRTAAIDMDEEEKLRVKLKEADSNHMEMAETLLHLCRNIMLTAETDASHAAATPARALEALRKIKAKIQSAEHQVNDLKLKARIVEEEQKLSSLRSRDPTL